MKKVIRFETNAYEGIATIFENEVRIFEGETTGIKLEEVEDDSSWETTITIEEWEKEEKVILEEMEVEWI